MDTLQNLIRAKNILIQKIKRKEITQYQAVYEYNALSAKIAAIRNSERRSRIVNSVRK